jgi:hypothetical protein
MALDGTWYSGGQPGVDDVLNADPLSNTRLGATLAVPTFRDATSSTLLNH